MATSSPRPPYDPAEPHLIPIGVAVTWTGRPAGTLHRWASEGRITRHGEGRRAQFDLHELPCKDLGRVVPSRKITQAA